MPMYVPKGPHFPIHTKAGKYIGDVPGTVMEEACRTGWVRPGLWAGEGLWVGKWLPDGSPDPATMKITSMLADSVLLGCPAFKAQGGTKGAGLAGLGLPSWAPFVLVGVVGFYLWQSK